MILKENKVRYVKTNECPSLFYPKIEFRYPTKYRNTYLPEAKRMEEYSKDLTRIIDLILSQPNNIPQFVCDAENAMAEISYNNQKKSLKKYIYIEGELSPLLSKYTSPVVKALEDNQDLSEKPKYLSDFYEEHKEEIEDSSDQIDYSLVKDEFDDSIDFDSLLITGVKHDYTGWGPCQGAYIAELELRDEVTGKSYYFAVSKFEETESFLVTNVSVYSRLKDESDDSDEWIDLYDSLISSIDSESVGEDDKYCKTCNLLKYLIDENDEEIEKVQKTILNKHVSDVDLPGLK